MVTVDNPEQYTLKGFRKSKTKGKKVDALLENKKTKKEKVVPFGLAGSNTYRNVTGVHTGDPTHGDSHKRANYRKRHDGEQKRKYSSGYWAYYYLW